MITQTGTRIEPRDPQQRTEDFQVAERIAESSPRLIARIAAVFYLLTILAGVYAQIFIGNRLIVDDDAVTTATNILTHSTLFQLGLAVYLIEMACQITQVALFYHLLKPVSRSVARAIAHKF
jgi:hypothetical protein